MKKISCGFPGCDCPPTNEYYCPNRRRNEPLQGLAMQNLPPEILKRVALRDASNRSPVQFCLHQIGHSAQYSLLRSYHPQKNEPADYSVEIASGTLDEMIEFKKQIMAGVRDEDGNLK